MATFVKIPFGEQGKHVGFFVLNVDRIRHMQYIAINEAIPKSTVVDHVPCLLVHYGDGRQTFIFNEQEAKILLEKIGITYEEGEPYAAQ